MKKYKQTFAIENGSDKKFDARELPNGTKFMLKGNVFIRTPDFLIGGSNDILLGISLDRGDWIAHSASHNCSPFVGTVTITQEEE